MPRWLLESNIVAEKGVKLACPDMKCREKNDGHAMFFPKPKVEEPVTV